MPAARRSVVMPLYSYNGGLLGTTSGLAGDANCCCGGSCQGPCQWQPVWSSSTGEWTGGWELVTGCQPATPECTCAEPAVSSVGTESSPSQEYWETPCGPPCTGAYDYVWYGEATGWLGLSQYCSTGCECPGPPGTPGPGDPTYVNLPCIPISAAP